MEQMTIFDFIGTETSDGFSNKTMEQIVDEVSMLLGVKFVKTHEAGEWLDHDYWEYKDKKKKLELSMFESTYQCDTSKRKEGDRFIGADYSLGNGGGGSPCDSIDEIIKCFRRVLKEAG